MKTEIIIKNGSGWNNYSGLRDLKSLKVGCRGMSSRQGLSKIELCPKDIGRPLGISARYFDATGEEIFSQWFDQNDSAEWIRERVESALIGGVKTVARSQNLARVRAFYGSKFSAWRRNFDVKSNAKKSTERLSVKFHLMRKRADDSHRPSRKLCTNLAFDVTHGRVKFADAINQIIAAGGK